MTTEHEGTTEMEVGYAPPFLRISAGYPPTMDRRLPEHINIELNVGDVSQDDEVDGTAFDGHFTEFVCEIVRSLGDVAHRGARQAPSTVVVNGALMTPEMAERLAAIVDGHAPGCDGKCDEQTGGAPTGPAASGEAAPPAGQPAGATAEPLAAAAGKDDA